MKEVKKSVLTRYTPAQMYALVADIESYPDFMPWCPSAEILAEDDNEVRARIDVAKLTVRKSFTLRNEKQENKLITMHLIEGTFSHLEGFWRFGESDDKGCELTLELEFDFETPMLGIVIGPVFITIAHSMVDSFHQRAQDMYGQRAAP